MLKTQQPEESIARNAKPGYLLHSQKTLLLLKDHGSHYMPIFLLHKNMTSPLITQHLRAPGINKENLTKQFQLLKYSYRNITSRKYEAKYMDINEVLNHKFCLKMKKKRKC